MLFNAEMHRSMKEVIDTITHELIHYELEDGGKPADHGKEFQRRAKKLGILGQIELDQYLDEIDSRPHTTQLKKIPLTEIAKEMDDHLEQLRRFAIHAPMSLRAKLYMEAKRLRQLGRSIA